MSRAYDDVTGFHWVNHDLVADDPLNPGGEWTAGEWIEGDDTNMGRLRLSGNGDPYHHISEHPSFLHAMNTANDVVKRWGGTWKIDYLDLALERIFGTLDKNPEWKIIRTDDDTWTEDEILGMRMLVPRQLLQVAGVVICINGHDCYGLSAKDLKPDGSVDLRSINCICDQCEDPYYHCENGEDPRDNYFANVWYVVTKPIIDEHRRRLLRNMPVKDMLTSASHALHVAACLQGEAVEQHVERGLALFREARDRIGLQDDPLMARAIKYVNSLPSYEHHPYHLRGVADLINTLEEAMAFAERDRARREKE